MKTSELQGAALDWAVCKANGEVRKEWLENPYPYSTNWLFGGPIIERERLQVTTDKSGEWICSIPYAVEMGGYRKYVFTCGPTPLIAAMRCLVASKLGDDIELPEGL